VADKDEVEPTDESSAALPADARDDAAAESEAAEFEAAEFEAAAELPGDPEPADELADPSIDDEPEDLTEPEDPDADFHEIVRNSGVSDANDPDGNAGDGDGKVLEPAGVGAAAAGRSGSTARPTPTPKGTPTSKRDQPAKREPRTTPAKFVRQSVGELRKVVYPTGEQLIKYFVVVLVFVLFIIAYVSVLDLAFGAAIFKIFS
jgi:preprotein translocase subunit SecE